MLALVNCATPVDPLEAKARDGDPVAACQLAAHNPHSCALEKQKWEAGEIAARPACIAQGISDQQEAYLDKADANLEDQTVNQILFGVTRIQLADRGVVADAGAGGEGDSLHRKAARELRQSHRPAEDLIAV
jgi:hypothetical protein